MAWIETEYAEQDAYTKTPIRLAYSRAFSKHFTKASGNVEINFETGRVEVSVTGLEPNPAGAAYEVWLVQDVSGPGNTAAIDLGSGGDRILSLGVLPRSGFLVTSLDPVQFARFEVNTAAVMRVSPDRTPEFVIGGMQSIRYLLGREARLHGSETAAGAVSTAGFGLTSAFAAVQGGPKKAVSLVAQGRDLFLNGTFGGNGRTCATCHRLDAETTIDRGFIALLPSNDPLFVSEFNPNLPPFDELNPQKPALEFPALMRNKGLILENIDGTEVDTSGNLLRPPVFRMTPALFNLSLTAPYGDSACCLDLQIFSAGAVFQHFPKTLNRVAGVDFVTPTATQLQALEAFQLSLSSPANGNLKVSGRGSFLSTKSDPLAADTNRPEVRGRNFFLVTNHCVACHQDSVFSAGTLNLDTGVEAFGAARSQTPTLDDGDNLGKFQVPQLFGLRKTHFFHNGVLGNNVILPPSGKTQLFANLRQAVDFYRSPEFRASPTGQEVLADNSRRFQALFDMTDAQVDDVTAFLEAISKN